MLNAVRLDSDIRPQARFPELFDASTLRPEWFLAETWQCLNPGLEGPADSAAWSRILTEHAPKEGREVLRFSLGLLSGKDLWFFFGPWCLPEVLVSSLPMVGVNHSANSWVLAKRGPQVDFPMGLKSAVVVQHFTSRF